MGDKSKIEWTATRHADGSVTPGGVIYHTWPDGMISNPFPKKGAGRTLDGRTWDEYPTPTEATRHHSSPTTENRQ